MAAGAAIAKFGSSPTGARLIDLAVESAADGAQPQIGRPTSPVELDLASIASCDELFFEVEERGMHCRQLFAALVELMRHLLAWIVPYFCPG